MKFSTKGRYGTRALIELANNGFEAPMSLGKISERTDISLRYLEQIMRKLKNSGIVRTVQGVRGGYVLSKRPEDISVRNIIDILECDDYPVSCVIRPECENNDRCAAQKVWKEVHKCIAAVLEKHSLASLCDIDCAK